MFFNEERNFYQLLEIHENASNDEILNAYLKAKSAYRKENNAHYSLLSIEERNTALEKIETAFQVLKDEQKRLEYNQSIGISLDISNKDSKENEIKVHYLTPKKIPQEQIIKIPPKSDLTQKANLLKDSIEVDIKNEKLWNGAFIKKIRIKKNISLEDLSNYTKISKRYLTYIEEDQYEHLPAMVYLRGFLTQICKRLNLPEKTLLEEYLKNISAKVK